MRLGMCLLVFGGCLFSYVEKQNEVARLKMELPELEKKILSVKEENRRLRYEVDQFENPTYLIELAHRPEFSHLKHPLLREILTVPEAIAVND